MKRFVVGFISDIWAKLWGHLWKCQQSSLSSVFSISELLPELFRDVLLGKTSQEMHMLCNHYSFLNHKLVGSAGSGLLLVCSVHPPTIDTLVTGMNVIAIQVTI